MTEAPADGGAVEIGDDAYRLQRLSYLASAIVGRPIDVAYTAKGAARTDGSTIFVCDVTDRHAQRKQVLAQSALLSGAVAAERLTTLRFRRGGLQRYLLLQVLYSASALSSEGAILRSGLDDLPRTVVVPRDPSDALRRAAGTEDLPAPPHSWGTIDLRLLRSNKGGPDAAAQRSVSTPPSEEPDEDQETDQDGGEPDGLFSSALGSSLLRRLFQKLAGAEQSQAASDPDGSEASTRAAGRWATFDSTRVRTSWLGRRGIAAEPPGLSWLKYPEWDYGTGAFKSDWCHVSVSAPADNPAAAGFDADMGTRAVSKMPLLRALSPIGLRRARVGRLPEGREVDLDAVIDAIADPLSDQDAYYVESLPLLRELGVLVLLDSSASTKDPSPAGGTVFERQLQAGSLVLDVTTRLGCRTAAFGFQSLGRKSVSLTALKHFEEAASSPVRRRLQQLSPAGYTRTGAAVRHGTHLLKTRSGTARGLLVVITDGFPFDIDYTDEYAQRDTAHALEEARASGIGCVCLSVGSNSTDDALAKVFGASTTAVLSDASELAPVARRLFADALKGADLRRRLAV